MTYILEHNTLNIQHCNSIRKQSSEPMTKIQTNWYQTLWIT